MAEVTTPSVTIDGKQYELDKISNEVKELISLHAQAQEMMISARRQAVIHEVSAINLASIIKSRVEAETSADKSTEPLSGHVVD
jgi:1,2-phenylacetyl-CoA epoxidase PaaB subunit